jgi:hypothetical protein
MRLRAVIGQSPSSSAAATAKNRELPAHDARGDYMVQLYRPRDEILNGTWKLPEAQPVN